MGATSYEFRTSLQALAGTGAVAGGGFTLAAARCVLGHDALALNNTMRASMVSDGPYLSIRRARLEGFDPSEAASGRYVVPCDLWIGIARETDNTFINIETFIEAIKTAWARYWLDWDYDPVDVGANPAIVHYVLTAQTIAC